MILPRIDLTGKNVFVTSDIHLGHHNIIRYCGRPFKDADEMNHIIITNWNNTIGVDDEVLFLGDFCMGNPNRFAQTLNGKIHLILGNHDDNRTWKNFPFASHQKQAIVEFYEHRIFLNHYPLWPDDYAFVEPLDQYDLVLHGHIHNKNPGWNYGCDHWNFNCCTENTNYTPIELKEIINQWMLLTPPVK